MILAPFSFMRRGAQGPVYDPDAQDWFDGIASAGSSIPDGNKAAADVAIIALKTAGLWSKINVLAFLSGPDDLIGAGVPVKGPAPTFINTISGAHTRINGIKGDSTAVRCINTNYPGNTDPTNDHHEAVWLTEPETTAVTILIAHASAGGSSITTNSVSGNFNSTSRGTSTFTATGTSYAGKTGMGCISRIASGNYRGLWPGNATTQLVSGSSSGTPDSTPIGVMCRYGAGGVLNFPSRAGYGMYSAGLGLTDAEMLTYRGIMQTYFASLS